MIRLAILCVDDEENPLILRRIVLEKSGLRGNYRKLCEARLGGCFFLTTLDLLWCPTIWMPVPFLPKP